MKIYGIFGFPLAHTLSPAMQEAAFGKTGIDATYLPLELDKPHFTRVARGLRKSALSGFNVTVPYKEMILRYVHRASPDARAIGAVNTVKRSGSRFEGHNTDWYGLGKALEEARFRLTGKKAVVLGAGGAARSVVYGLLKMRPQRITILNRHPARAQKIRRDFTKLFPRAEIRVGSLKTPSIKQALAEADLLINATSVGLKGSDPALVSKAWLKRRTLVYDLIYNPAETKLLRTAKAAGCRTLNGLSMLLHQGARAFEIWTGKKAPVNVMRKALMQALENKE